MIATSKTQDIQNGRYVDTGWEVCRYRGYFGSDYEYVASGFETEDEARAYAEGLGELIIN